MTTLVIIGLVAYFATVGLAEAAEIATVVAVPIALVALAVGIWGLLPKPTAQPEPEISAQPNEDTNTLASTDADRSTQTANARRDVYMAAGNMTVHQPAVHPKPKRDKGSQGQSP